MAPSRPSVEDRWWEEAKDAFARARELPVAHRPAFLDTACRGDSEFREFVSSLLELSSDGDPEFLQPPTLSLTLHDEALRESERVGEPPTLGVVGESIVQRYVLDRRLGAGASGEVYLAIDQLSQQPVAIKLLRGLSTAALGQVRAEVSALRFLHLPGIVTMLDEGTDQGRPFIVMQYVEGSPFPGGSEKTGQPTDGAAWAKIQDVVIALLETLSRLHGAGFIHRDLKPSNVYVDGDAHLTVLDLGLAARPDASSSLQVAGTPAYMAPELFSHAQATVASDLYAVGIMTYEALVGSRPHDERNLETLARARSESTAPAPIDQRGVPSEVANLVHALLQPSPADRPRSAAEALSLLGHEFLEHASAKEIVARLNELRGDSSVGALAPEQLEPLFRGPERLFRLQSDVAKELWLRTRGVPGRIGAEISAWTRAGLARWEDRQVCIDRGAADQLLTGVRVASARYERHDEQRALEQGDEIVLAHISLLTPRSRVSVLAELTHRPRHELQQLVQRFQALSLVRVSESGEIEARSPLDVERVLSHETMRRSQQLMATAMAPGDEGRFQLLIGAESISQLPEESLAQARRLVRAGRTGLAFAYVLQGLSAARQVGAPELDLLEELMLVAHRLVTPAQIRRALHESEVCEDYGPRVEQLVALGRASLVVSQGARQRGLDMITAVPPFESRRLELLRQRVRMLAARRVSPRHHAEVLDDIDSWVEGMQWPQAKSALAGFRGWQSYVSGRYEEAARFHLESARLGATASDRMIALVNGASAAMEAGDFAAASASLSEAMTLAEDVRSPFTEARAVWLERSIAYRQDAVDEPDLELVEAAAHLEVDTVEALICLTEAAIAWRSGRTDTALRLARLSSQRAGTDRPYFVLARTLAICCGENVSDEEFANVQKAARESPFPGLAIQCVGLLARSRPRMADLLRELVTGLSQSIPRRHWPTRREVISVDEAIRFCLG